jgi:hypothetical protein
MKIPPEYPLWLEALGFREVSFGYSGLELFALEELGEGQTGYSKSPEGRSLCDDGPGSWKPEWLVIGHDTLVGDPIILDTASSTLRVTTAMHGEGSWDPYPIASSLPAFANALRIIRQYSEGREYPVALEQNPLPPEDRRRALKLIQDANDAEITLEFWELILESGQP